MPEQYSENRLIAERRRKLAAIRQRGIAFPNDFHRTHLAGQLAQQHAEHDRQYLQDELIQVSIAGRLMSRRVMGKASFVHVRDMSGQIQLYVQRHALPDGFYDDFGHWDVGDIVGAEGTLFRTNKGELSVRVAAIRLLTKSLRPLPEKFHGLTDTEARYRQRYVDLIMNPEVRRVFHRRAEIIGFMRDYFNGAGFLEVETPMMHSIPGGAAARPFETHHNALDMPLYLRIAPELYLKRLVVGGIENVFEINRNFRNEGLSARHNPEFTMIEFYKAYANYCDLMDLTEDLLCCMTRSVLGTTTVNYQGRQYDFSPPFARMTLKEAILHYNKNVSSRQLESVEAARMLAKALQVSIEDDYPLGRIQLEIFECTVERLLDQPTFITAYPAEVSPLARRNDENPEVTDRFEFFVAGHEIANGFSELNDAEDQAQRFRQQMQGKDAEHHEAYDADYITALEYGLPPAAGEGIGIDRLVMLLTDSLSIRDVLFFPQMRPEKL